MRIATLETMYRRHSLVGQIVELLEEYTALVANEQNETRDPSAPGVLVITPEPVVAEGFRSLLSTSEMRLAAVSTALPEALEQIDRLQPDLVVLHANPASMLDQIALLHGRSPACAIVLWVEKITLAMAGRAVEVGVRGILPTTCLSDKALEALRAISRGEMRLDLPSKPCLPIRPDVKLSKGQRKLVELVGQGLKNKEIATILGSTEGTVKTSLNRLFRALGVKDRLEAALYALEVQTDMDSFAPGVFDGCEWRERSTAPPALAPAHSLR